MINGIGISEVLLVGALVLLFFGSKELPRFIREGAKLLAKARRYSDKVRREINEVTRSLDVAESTPDETVERKKALRQRLSEARKALSPEEKQAHSDAITKALLSEDTVASASAVMVYIADDFEVATQGLIAALLEKGTRVVVPYCHPHTHDLGIAAIADMEKDLAKGAFGILEPVESLRENFFKSDLKLILCPGVGFDRSCGRLGRGKGFYDNFLREIKGRIPAWGLAFSCQISDEPLPFSYSDVSVDQVVTENGLLVGAN